MPYFYHLLIGGPSMGNDRSTTNLEREASRRWTAFAQILPPEAVSDVFNMSLASLSLNDFHTSVWLKPTITEVCAPSSFVQRTVCNGDIASPKPAPVVATNNGQSVHRF